MKSDRLIEDGYITCSYLVAKTFGINESILLEYLVGWGASRDWRYRSHLQITEDTCLTRQQQRTAREKLKDLGVLEEDVRNVPPTVHFKVDWERALELMAATPKRNQSIVQNQPIDCPDSTNQEAGFNQSIKERVRKSSQKEKGSAPDGDLSKKTRTPSGPAQQIVAAYCQKAGIERPVSYGQAVGLAQKMADAGIVPADISSLYDYVSSWATGVDMTLMFKQADSWRASRTSKPVAKSTSRWSREEELAARSGYALLNMGGDE